MPRGCYTEQELCSLPPSCIIYFPRSKEVPKRVARQSPGAPNFPDVLNSGTNISRRDKQKGKNSHAHRKSMSSQLFHKYTPSLTALETYPGSTNCVITKGCHRASSTNTSQKKAMYLPEQSFYSALFLFSFFFLWREERNTHNHCYYLYFITNLSPNQSLREFNAAQTFSDKWSGALQSLQSWQTDTKWKNKK